jgi:hypothetical protein
MARPERTADSDTVRRLAEYAGLPLAEDRVERQVEGVHTILTLAEGWAKHQLGYRFGPGGSFGHVPMVARYIPAWDVPTGLNKQRVVEVQDGEVVLTSSGSEEGTK